MKIFSASLATETNTFSPMPTGLKSFAVTRKGDYSTYPPFRDSVVAMWHRMAVERGDEFVESLIAAAEPAGKTLRKVYEDFRDEIIADLKAALPVDAVLLDLHGAMVADGYDDCEGDLIAAVRQVVGADVPIGVELDLHCHISSLMVEQATAIITYKEYPHTDLAERGIELFNLIVDAVEGRVKPTMALVDCGMISLYYPTQEPVKSYVAKLKALEGRDGVLSVSLGHGFPWGDVPDLGTKALVVTDNDPSGAEELAASLAREFYAMRARTIPYFYDIDGALDHALAAPGAPIVIADVSDNPGGGAPCDSTFVLRRMLERGITNVALGCIWDPIAASIAIEAGEGAVLDLRVGGKMGVMSGDPLDLHVTVGKIALGALQYFGPDDAIQEMPLGDSVAINANGIDIVLISTRTQTFSPHVFTNVGIDPGTRKILIVKSTQHFYARFAPIASEVIYVAAPGAVAPDFKSIPYQVASRHRYPMVDDPLGLG
ncbi:MAG: M81 family metallopeptidase [Anaerolineae bacterium]|nr:M81 family metallopeptidase [Anaerolineae bacterium]